MAPSSSASSLRASIAWWSRSKAARRWRCSLLASSRRASSNKDSAAQIADRRSSGVALRLVITARSRQPEQDEEEPPPAANGGAGLGERRTCSKAFVKASFSFRNSDTWSSNFFTFLPVSACKARSSLASALTSRCCSIKRCCLATINWSDCVMSCSVWASSCCLSSQKRLVASCTPLVRMASTSCMSCSLRAVSWDTFCSRLEWAPVKPLV
mmetsp:Transcript_44636/g.129878  ORF Transcript_44636/g.129878 Transcript_44636/m.129878 type:complete len:212 (-) Transcript_44636:388-1023(-)